MMVNYLELRSVVEEGEIDTRPLPESAKHDLTELGQRIKLPE